VRYEGLLPSIDIVQEEKKEKPDLQSCHAVFVEVPAGTLRTDSSSRNLFDTVAFNLSYRGVPLVALSTAMTTGRPHRLSTKGLYPGSAENVQRDIDFIDATDLGQAETRILVARLLQESVGMSDKEKIAHVREGVLQYKLRESSWRE
jgi:hypothetical protein